MNKFSLSMKGLDELFSSQEMRDEERLAKILEIPLSEIDTFPGHPFKVVDNEDMQHLAESISTHGVVTPATVRTKPDGRYELISGHRRKRACELAGLTTLRCEVVDMNDDEATILMVESNLHRSVILPSEKAFSYKMRLDAIKRQKQQAMRVGAPLVHPLNPDEGAPLVHPISVGKSRDIISEETGESREQIRRYIRLTELIPPLLNLADSGALKLRPAVELSYLDKESQELIANSGVVPTYAQAHMFRAQFEECGCIDIDILTEKKTTSKPRKLSLDGSIRNYIPPTVKDNELEDYIRKALEAYNRNN